MFAYRFLVVHGAVRKWKSRVVCGISKRSVFSTGRLCAGRLLFQASRQNKKIPNDADRLRKYLARFGFTWDELQA